MKQTVLIVSLSFLLAACGIPAAMEAKAKPYQPPPVNCATAESDLRIMEAEKFRIKARTERGGVPFIAPISLVVGARAGDSHGDKYKISTGDYNDMIDKRMAEIKRECGL